MTSSGKAAQVTGAAGGLGAATVTGLRAGGARVVVADRDVSGIEAEAHLPEDLLDAAYADGLAPAAPDALAGLDVVVDEAGVITSGFALYGMTEAAPAWLTQCMGTDHAHRGIQANAVCADEVNTPMLRSGFMERGLDLEPAVAEPGRTVPLGRIAEADDIVGVVLCLASEAAGYMGGALVEVSRGKPVP